MLGAITMRNGSKLSDKRGLLIVVAGLMGCGKSTLIDGAEERGLKVFRELPPQDNPHFTAFYEALSTPGENPFALPSQLAFLLHSFEQAKEIAELRKTQPEQSIVWEMPPWAHFMYAWMQHKGDSAVMSKEDWLVYRANFKVVWRKMSELPLLPQVTAITYIEDLDTLYRRINNRGRSEEDGIPRDYLAKLQQYWDKRLQRKTLLPKKAQEELLIPEQAVQAPLTRLDAAKHDWTNPSGFSDTWQYMMQHIAPVN